MADIPAFPPSLPTGFRLSFSHDHENTSPVNTFLFAAIRFLFKYAGNCCPTLFARWGIYLWGKTHRLPWRPWETAIMQSARRQTLLIENEEIAIYHWGQGEQKILLLPGWNSRASHFRNYIAQLTALGYSVIGLDPVGHGHSSGNWTNLRQYLSVIQSVDREFGPFHTVIGHSFGGFCIPYALQHFSIAKNAVLLATPDKLLWLFERYVHILRAPAAVQSKMQQQVEVMLGKDCWQTYTIAEQAKNLAHVPALIVHDEDDPGVPHTHALDNQAAWPGAKLLTTYKLGHHRVLRHPSALKPVIAFIQEH